MVVATPVVGSTLPTPAHTEVCSGVFCFPDVLSAQDLVLYFSDIQPYGVLSLRHTATDEFYHRVNTCYADSPPGEFYLHRMTALHNDIHCLLEALGMIRVLPSPPGTPSYLSYVCVNMDPLPDPPPYLAYSDEVLYILAHRSQDSDFTQYARIL